MGWLFGRRKKVPLVPFPEGRMMDENALRLPGRISTDRIIEPDYIKQAAGVEMPPLMPRTMAQEPFPTAETIPPGMGPENFVYVKVDVYQRVLGELELIRGKLAELQEIDQHLQSSEYNEEHNFVKLRRAVKSMHDRFLLIDRTIFKMQGD